MASDTYLLSLFLYLTMLTPSLQQQCPSGCRCPSGTEVRCSNAGLTAIPPDIPTTVEKLFLDGNRITEVNSSQISALQHLKQLYLPRNRIRSVQNFANLPNLEILNLASNNISYIDNDTFENSTRLKYIFLSKNSLIIVPTGLERLDNLQILTLDDNNIRTANAAFFHGLGSILRIDLHNNPWSCDCRLRGLKQWMSETQAEISLRENVTCASPENLIGRAIDDVRADDMVCAKTATFVCKSRRYHRQNNNTHSKSRPHHEKVVTERQLRALSENLGMEWEQLSTELGFTNAQLWQFKEDNPRNVRQAMFEMLNKWRRNHRREATIGRLVRHMRNVHIDEDTYGVLLN
ncbi:Slit 2 protein [Branchiostoma belcheri]|nr:Slit 2 protein [Branchiostoma belcheri]